MKAIERLHELGSIDPRHVRDGGDALLRLVSTTVSAARKFLAVAVVGVTANAVSVGVLLAYLLQARTAPTVAILVAAGVALPGVALVVYAWMFRLATRMPECVQRFVNDFSAALRQYQETETAADPVPGQSRNWPQRMESLVRAGRLAFDVYRAVERQPDVHGTGPLRAVSLMAWPPFWIGFAAAVGFALTYTVLVPLVCLALHLLR
jgi:hypothetical protein